APAWEASASVAFELNLPIDHPTLLDLSVGTRVAIQGTVITAGAEVHRQLAEGAEIPEEVVEGSLLFHCRPHLVRKGKRFHALAIEPEVSAPYEPQVPDWLSGRHFRGFLGYGGFSDEVFQHFRRFTGCYLQTFAGAGASLARYVTGARELPFGSGLKGPDAMWALEVGNLPAVVTMDFQGSNLLQMISQGTARNLASIGE
ncbi:MAG: fumarate hydratase C-terminal domain-containing protein, partial [Planctomycetota bacterium]